MSQSRFSIVLVGVSALLRRPLVSRLRSAVFTARGSGGFRRSVVGLRVHCFRFSARTASELPLGGLAFGLTASAFRHAPLRGCPRRVGASAFRFGDGRRAVGLRVHRFRFSACTASEWPLGGFVLSPSASEIPFGELAFGFTASVFRHAPIRSGRWASSFFRLPHRRLPSAGWFFRSVVGLRVHCFRFSARTALELPSSGWPSAHRFRFSACTDPHRCTAEARTDGAHRHDNCFTSKHLSQHVNLPHRTP